MSNIFFLYETYEGSSPIQLREVMFLSFYSTSSDYQLIKLVYTMILKTIEIHMLP